MRISVMNSEEVGTTFSWEFSERKPGSAQSDFLIQIKLSLTCIERIIQHAT